MKNGKRKTPERNSHKEKSRGTVWAERTRAQCNTLTASQREKLLDRLTLELQSFDATAPVISTPREIVRKFFR